MVTALIITLFVIQLITIFIIILLSGKLAKFKELEIRQNQLVEEMDNAISVYLIEMKEENNRLIEELKEATVSIPAKPAVQPFTQTQPQVEVAPIATVNAKKIFDEIAENEVKKEKTPPQTEVPEFEKRKFVPVQQAANAYSKQKVQTDKQSELEQVEDELFAKELVKQQQTVEQQVVAHYRAGKSIEEIARMMQRGKTEIELLVKFHA